MQEDLDIPEWYSYSAVIEELRRAYPPKSQQGFTVFFTGLSGSGKSTIASAVRLFHEHVLVKEPGADVNTPWHHDMPYYCVDTVNTVSLWIPVDDVPRERTLEFVAGSHRWGTLYRPDRFNGDALNPGDGLPQIPDIDGDRSAYTILGWALQAGDAVAFDFRTVHGAAANHSTHQQRRALSLRLVGDDARFRRPAGVSSPPFRGVTLAQGAALDGPEFPLIAGSLSTGYALHYK